MTAAPYSDERIRECPLVSWSGDPGRCRWCDAPLVGRQRRWCASCPDAYTTNHYWQSARVVALQRDGYRCVRCDWREDQAVGFARLLAALMAPRDIPGWSDPQTFIAAHPRLVDTPARSTFQVEHRALILGSSPEGVRHRWGWALNRLAGEAERARRLEVNHVVPILGRHAEVGCHHHPDGLETLCHRCHVAETARQFGHRSAAPTLFDQGSVA